MSKRFLAMIVIGAVLSSGAASAAAEDSSGTSNSVALSPGLLDLLRQEMREISGAVQGISLALATGDYKVIEDTAAKIRTSYIMGKELTASQAHELERALPERFKQLDSEFHHRAGALELAAGANDFEVAAFHYSRLLETCARCHSEYATSRFPGLAPGPREAHQH
jgi:hypothetical protein